jgi:hypothetical protein
VTPRHTYHRSDGNQREIVDALRACGSEVQSLSSVGQGCPDLLVFHRDRLYLLEIKNGTKLRESQENFRARWKCVRVVSSVDEALKAVGIT